ncbi:unnamed protein product [Owenia fusiformis]|uniref:Uncharacterized protein n=1 Tax=Owenia fusiformis TaxID=6347 RepID=A0A8J1Y276_OWEFU|nr:unnamed protein product [Owenia fusiformis]
MGILLLYCSSILILEQIGFGYSQTTVFEKNILKRHNELRALHENTPPLKWHKSMATRALNYCRSLARTGRFAHSSSASRKNPHAGENLWRMSSTIKAQPNHLDSFGIKAAQDWYDEIKYYDYKKPVFGTKTGHFTQLVWDNTESVGCGLASGKKGMWNTYTVCCQYTPPGNYIGQFAQRVHRLKPKITTTTTTTTTPRPETKDHVPTRPKNGGMLKRCLRGTCTATYSCDTCFTLSGPAKAKCKSTRSCEGSSRFCDPVGPDHEDEKTCVLKKRGNTCDRLTGCTFMCPQLNSPVHGSITPTATTAGTSKSGTKATYACDTGYVLVGTKLRTCGRDGMWSGSAPGCVKAGALGVEFNAQTKLCGDQNGNPTVKIGQDAAMEVTLKYTFNNPNKLKTVDAIYHVLVDGPGRGLVETKLATVPKATTNRPGTATNMPNGDSYKSKFICSKTGTFTLKFSSWLSGQSTKIVESCEIKCVN